MKTHKIKPCCCRQRIKGINLFLADGKAAGQEVLHTHLHIIPRFSGDGFGLKFGPEFGKKPARQELEGVVEKIKERL